MLTCLVLVDDPPRCSECKKKKEIIMIENKTYELAKIYNLGELKLSILMEKLSENTSPKDIDW